MRKLVPLFVIGLLMSCASNQLKKSEHGYAYARVPASLPGIVPIIRAIKGGEKAAVEFVNASRSSFNLTKTISSLDEVVEIGNSAILHSLTRKAMLGHFGPVTKAQIAQLKSNRTIYNHKAAEDLAAQFSSSKTQKSSVAASFGNRAAKSADPNLAEADFLISAAKGKVSQKYIDTFGANLKQQIKNNPEDAALLLNQLEQGLEAMAKSNNRIRLYGSNSYCKAFGEAGNQTITQISEEALQGIDASVSVQEHVVDYINTIYKIIDSKVADIRTYTKDQLVSVRDRVEFMFSKIGKDGKRTGASCSRVRSNGCPWNPQICDVSVNLLQALPR